MIDQWNITLPQFSKDQPRRVYVYLPNQLQEHPDWRFPVLYMFDGHNVFFDSHATYGKSWGLKDYLDAHNVPLIVAAVECNHSPDGGRLSEYSPFSFTDPKLGSICGRGQEMMDWMTEEFKPYIDAHYPTIPDRAHTFIGGSSMGGLMSLYAALQYNHIFSRAAALSPSIWFATDQLETMIRTAPVDPETVIYMDYGSREIHHHANMEHQFGEVTALLLERHISLCSRIVPHGDHCEASWERQIPFFLSTLLYDC